jgi:hypothetical protein
MRSEQEAFDELCGYTLAHGDPSFIHQYVVDAFAVQRADERTKPIKITFGLVGLYLKVERRYSGKQVQRAHMSLARRKRAWPTFALPRDRGAITAIDVLAAPSGPERDRAIDAWCASVWEAFRDHHRTVAAILEQYEIVGPAAEGSAAEGDRPSGKRRL